MERTLYRCFSEMGGDFIRNIDFNLHTMERTLKEREIKNTKCTPYIINRVKGRFEIGKEYWQNDALIKLKAIYKRNGIAGRVTTNDLKLYFKVENKRLKDGRRIILHEKNS